MKTIIVATTSAVIGFTFGVIAKAACDKFSKKKEEKCKESPTEEKK